MTPRTPAFAPHPLRLALRRALGLALLLPAGPLLAEEANITLDAVTVEAEAIAVVTEGSERYQAPATDTALGLSLTPRETPQSVSVVTRAQIDDFNLDSVNDVLESTPGIGVERVETDRTYYTARGFDITNFQVDGQGMPFVYDNVQGDLDTYIYDRVEVLRGANGLLSGTGNPAATINFVRKRPTATPQASLGTTLGRWDQRRLEVDLAGPLDAAGRVRGRFVAAGEEKDSYLDRMQRSRRVLYGVIEADLGDTTQLTAGHSWQRNDTDSPLWGALPLYYSDGSPTDYDVSTSTSADWAYWNNRDQHSFIELSQAFAGGWEGRATLTHIQRESDSKLFYIYGTPDRDTGSGLFAYPSRYDLENEQWIADLSARGRFELGGREHEAVLGAQWSRSHLQDVSHYGQGIGDPLPPLEEWQGNYPEPAFDAGVAGSDWVDRETALYGALRLSASDRLMLLGGLRLADFEGEGENYGDDKTTSHRGILTPYAGAVYDLNDALSLYASYTRIFRPQTEVDRNRDRLDPVEGDALEAGLKAELFDGRLDASLALFQIEQSNLAEAAGTIPGSADTFYRGVDGLTSRGVEATLAGELAPGWQASLGYTVLSIEDADGEAARTHAPRHMLRAMSRYRLPFLEQASVGARLRWQGDIHREQGNGVITRQEDYALVDLMARYDFNERLSATLNLNNVTDEKYLTSLYWAQGFYGAPRHAMLSLDWRY
ncbi:TonB-dependent receptor [Bisbaumannia pacifica]|uniref:TonB-dependent receptor n=1 Tax=Bisbaumannia pacifica TaxID=77098 RepID=A0A510X7B9_9GAMM|nr:TonB-dependent siderophore receptor [Halomonas pacifica]GEK47336.1 TonB-dependent receptor [Halomonas pacifica]